jgi:hypothetical protein
LPWRPPLLKLVEIVAEWEYYFKNYFWETKPLDLP